MAPKPKSWFVRQQVLGANIHETEGLLERNIAFTLHEILGFDNFSLEHHFRHEKISEILFRVEI